MARLMINDPECASCPSPWSVVHREWPNSMAQPLGTAVPRSGQQGSGSSGSSWSGSSHGLPGSPA